MSLSPEGNEANRSCEFKDNLEILREIHFFSGLPLEALKVFAYLCIRESFEPGDYLFYQDEDDGQAFYILGGTARLVRANQGDECAIRDYDRGAFIGGMALVANMRRLFSLKAQTDVCCLIMHREKFIPAMEQFPDVMPKIFKAVVEGIRIWEERLIVGHARQCEEFRECVGVSLL